VPFFSVALGGAIFWGSRLILTAKVPEQAQWMPSFVSKTDYLASLKIW